jgi:predicted metalloprotease with PDZ domain
MPIPATSIRYRLDLSDARRRQIGVEMTVDRQANEVLDFVMPQLSPGSPTNSLNQPSRILGVRATDAHDQPLNLEKTAAGHWRLESQTQGPVRLHYRIKADEFSHVRSYLSERLAYLNGPSALMYVEGRQSEPSTIELGGFPSQSWRTSSTLESVPGQPQIFYASHYDDIADSNLLAGEFQQVCGRHGQTLLQINQNGTPPWTGLKVNGATPEQSLEDLTRLYATFTQEFGEFPRQRCHHARELPAEVDAQDKYVVTKHYLHGQGPNAGGYEHYHGHELLLHKAAEASILRRFDGDGRAHERHIMAHELMHKLIAKFVRHQDIDSADLSRVGSTDGLWLSEGGVEWAAMELQCKSGQISEQQYQKMLQAEFRSYELAYAQDPSNARDNSFDAHLGNGGFYNKGAVTCALLDIELKAASAGRLGMFDVFRQLKDEFGGQDRFWGLPDIERIATQLAGPNSDRIVGFFQDYLHDRKPFDFPGILAQAGLEWKARGDNFAPGQLDLPGGLRLSSDAFGQARLSTAPDSQAQAGTLTLPAFGLTLSASAQGQLKLAGITPNGPAADQGLARWVGQAAVLQSAPGPLGELKLQFSGSDPFTGQAETRSIQIEAQPALQSFLQRR